MNDSMRLDWLQKEGTRVRGRQFPHYNFEVDGHSRGFEMSSSSVSKTSLRACIDAAASGLPTKLRRRQPQPRDRRRLDWLAIHCGLMFQDLFSGKRRMYVGGGFIGFFEAKTVRGVIDKAMKAIQREKRKMRTGRGH